MSVPRPARLALSAVAGGLIGLAPLVSPGLPTAATAVPTTTPPTQPGSTEPRPLAPLELVPDLGLGGQPEDVPREVVIGGARFLFDRVVPLRHQELVRIAQVEQTSAYARTEVGPFPAVYLSVPDRGDDELARFLPELLGSPDVACPAETAATEPIDAGGRRYVPAGIETDLTVDALQQVGVDAAGEPLFADPGTEPPFSELFRAADDGLLRHLLLDDVGRPVSLAESLAFNGVQFGFQADATDLVDPASLTKVGCSTAFSVYTPTGVAPEGPDQLYVMVGDRYLLFTVAGSTPPIETIPPATEPPATEPTTGEATTIVPETTSTDPEPTTAVPTTTTTVPTTTTTTTTVPAPTTTTVPTTTTTLSSTTTVAATTTTTPTTTSAPATTTTTTTTTPTTTTEPTPPTARATTACAGNPGEPDGQGIPRRLPTRFHLDGVAYFFAGVEAADSVGVLSAIGCLGPFESATTDHLEQIEVVYLRITDPEVGADEVYRFEPGLTFQVHTEVGGRPRAVTAGEVTYLLSQVWRPSIYSSTSVILFVPDPGGSAPPVVYARPVTETVTSQVIGEYRLLDGSDERSPHLPTEEVELNPDLTLAGEQYVLADVYVATGITADGSLTLFGPAGGDTTVLLGREASATELLIFEPEVRAEATG